MMRSYSQNLALSCIENIQAVYDCKHKTKAEAAFHKSNFEKRVIIDPDDDLIDGYEIHHETENEVDDFSSHTSPANIEAMLDSFYQDIDDVTEHEKERLLAATSETANTSKTLFQNPRGKQKIHMMISI